MEYSEGPAHPAQGLLCRISFELQLLITLPWGMDNNHGQVRYQGSNFFPKGWSRNGDPALHFACTHCTSLGDLDQQVMHLGLF